MNKGKVFFVSFFLLFAIFALNTSIVVAEEEINLTSEEIADEEVTAEDLGIAEPNILPDNKLYFVKEWSRDFSLFFTFNPIKKAERRFQHANERLIEAKKLAEKTGNEEVAVKAVEKYQNTIDRVANKIEELKDKAKDNPRFQNFVDKFTEDGLAHQRLLLALKNKFKNAPENIRERLVSVRERGVERMGGVLNSVDGDKMNERLDRIMEKVESSSVRKLENIEILKRVQLNLQNKLPEGAKAVEVIGNVIDRQTERVGSRVRNVYNIRNDNCKDLCGDNVCAKTVCLAVGCPCLETLRTCPQDCSNEVLDEINSFEKCVRAGYLVMESYPRRCVTRSGRSFTEQIKDVNSTNTEKVIKLPSMKKILEPINSQKLTPTN